MGAYPKGFCTERVTNKGYGRIEVRILTTSSQLNNFLPGRVPQAQADWPFLSTGLQTGTACHRPEEWETRHETVFGITSLSADQASPAQLLQMFHSCWQIENSLHYPRDVTLVEDQIHFKNHSAAHVMAIITT